MKFKIKYSGTFKKSYKLCKRRGYDMSLLQEAISILAEEGELPSKYKAHILSGRLGGIWECHLNSNWLLLWIKEDKEMTLLFLDTGTHSDVLK